MNPDDVLYRQKLDDVLGGHQWSELFTSDLTSYSTDTDTYYLQHGGSETVSKFVVFRSEDKVVINGSEIVNKLSARMRWDYLIKEDWKRTSE